MQLQQRAQRCGPAAACPGRRLRAHRALVVCSSNGNGSKGTSTIRRLIEAEGGLLIPGCYDALSARILQRAGHKAGFVSGAGVSATLLGEADLGLLSPAEMAERTAQICAAVPGVPVLADVDSGGSSVLSVQRIVRTLIAAGARGMVIEDKKDTGTSNKEVVSMEEFVGKVAAARDAIGSSDFFLVARTDARSTSAKNGLEDAIRRANLYVDAGADASMVESPRGFDEIRLIAENTKGLRAINQLEGGIAPLATSQDLHAMGFHIVLHPLTALYTATRALMESYGSLAENGTTTEEALKQMVGWREFNFLVGMDDRVEQVNRFAKGEGLTQRLTVKVRAPAKPVALGPHSEWPRRPE